jgi:hypothetical protein
MTETGRSRLEAFDTDAHALAAAIGKAESAVPGYVLDVPALRSPAHSFRLYGAAQISPWPEFPVFDRLAVAVAHDEPPRL